MPTGSGALVPVGLGEPDSSDCERGLDSHLLPPGILCSRLSPDTGRPPERRAKSVSYDVNKPVIIPIQRLAAGGEGDVVETVPPQLRAELSRAESQLRKLRSSVFPRVCRSADRGPLSCTELLAISGALSAALPAQLAQVPLRHSSQQLPSALAGVTGGPVTTRQLSEPALPGLGSPPLDSARTASDASWSGDSEESCSSDEEGYSDEDCEEYWSEYEDDEPRTPRCPRVRAVLRWIRASVKRFIEHSYTQKGILLAIMINTLSMGVEYHNQPPWLTTLVETSNIVFSAVFALEMMLKLIADGFYGYIRNGFNVFDGLIVIISAVDLYKSQFSTTGSEGGSSLSVLRTFRLLRILKLVRFLPNLRRQLLVMLKTMDNVAIFFSLLILFIFIFSVLGMILFGGKFCMRRDGTGPCECRRLHDMDPNCICQRKNFDNFLWSTVTVFQILTQEDWNVVLFNGMERTSPWAALYFVALMTFGNYVLFNLLVAILVEGFSSEVGECRNGSGLSGTGHCSLSSCPSTPGRSDVSSHEPIAEEGEEGTSEQETPQPTLSRQASVNRGQPRSCLARSRSVRSGHKVEIDDPASAPTADRLSGRDEPYQRYNGRSSVCSRSSAAPKFTVLALDTIPLDRSGSALTNSISPHKKVPKLLGLFEPLECMKKRADWSLYLFAPDNVVRRLCRWLTAQRWFDHTILFFIALNCITLAMERPNIPPDSYERAFLVACNYLFTVVFGLEMLVKVISHNLLYGHNSYFSSGWNVMDGILVFRLLRSLRPLRVINRAPGLKLVVQTLLSSLKPIGNIVLICMTFFVIFGILGVQLFKGTFYYCDGDDLVGVTNKTECLSRPGNVWVNRKYNFDNLGTALMALFVLSSKDGWVNIMYTGLDAVGVDQQPIENYSEWRLVYFISFLLLVGFFVLNMFVGVVVENFHRCREEQEKEEKARRAAKRAKKMEKKRKSMMLANGCEMREQPYYATYTPGRLLIHNIVTSKYFDLAIANVIGLNVVSMAMEYYKMPELRYALRVFNFFFTAVFTLEMLMKVVALGWRRYLKDRWNQLDVGIVVLSVVGIVLEEMENDLIPINPTIIRVMRVMRIARVLKLLKMAKGIRALLDTVMQALPQVGNLGLLFFLLFFIFAALGVELFGRLECKEEYPCQGLGEHANFRNFGIAYLTLFRVATGDNWNGIMKDTLRENCDSSADCIKNCCVSPVIAPIFFVVFVLMAQFVLVNVVVAVLMKHLEDSHKQMEDDVDMELELERQMEREQQLDNIKQVQKLCIYTPL
ncbi:Voltage-dependent T-type calcium channel subunit alpha-1I [Amphibalanus amphitrite]|uniref:Voltage-dependent T-type calcium channel subunit alpha-1I n=1 Tax=Amphibalanus amphitrite TaxID=1232801 RepID=A0A6A4W9H7_AMPAM|nr:Voltage-dependent T-type calcium channel subunit alpha-1I [Amphibalanus amphitrite]